MPVFRKLTTSSGTDDAEDIPLKSVQPEEAHESQGSLRGGDGQETKHGRDAISFTRIAYTDAEETSASFQSSASRRNKENIHPHRDHDHLTVDRDTIIRSSQTFPESIHSTVEHSNYHSQHSVEWNVEINQGLVMKAEMLLLRLAKAFFIFGAPLYRLEVRVQSVADQLGLPLSILPLPTSITLSFGDGTPNFWPQTFLVKGSQGLNMAKLQEIDRWALKLAGSSSKEADNQMRERLLQAIHEHEESKKTKSQSLQPSLQHSLPRSSPSLTTRSPSDPPPHHLPRIERSLKNLCSPQPRPTLAISERELDIYLEELDKVVNEKDYFHKYLRVLCTAIIGSSLFTIWNPVGWRDYFLSFSLSFLNGVLCMIGERHHIATMEILVPMVIGSIGKLCAIYFLPHCCIDNLIILSCFNLFPGISITLAMVELASGNMVAGTVRMFYSFIRSLKLGFGVSVGSRLAHWISNQSLNVSLTCPKRPDTVSLKENPILVFLVFLPLSACINIYLMAHPKQFPLMSGVSFLGFVTLWVVNLVFEKDTSVAFSAFVIGMISHIYARLFNDIAIASILGGIFWLVPGALGVSGATMLFMDKDFSGSTEFATQTLSNAMSISIGLYLSSLAIFPFKKKRKFLGLSFF